MNALLGNFDLSKFGDYDSYLINKLNNGEELTEEDYDVTKLASNFASSSRCFLHDGPFKKTIVTAFHIAKQIDKTIHHYDIHVIRFKRKKKSEPWVREEIIDLRDKEVENLCVFLNKQQEFIGKPLNKNYYKIVSAESSASLKDLDKLLEQLNKQASIDGENLEGNGSNILALISKLLEGKSVLLEKGIYKELVKAKISTKSITEYKENLEEFRKLIENESTTETEMQTFLQDKVWFFGLDYIQSHRRSIPKFSSTLGSQYDFLLEGFNQIYDIVELKGPNEPLFDIEKSGERSNAFDSRIDYKFSEKFSRALHQVLCYMDEFEKHFEHIKSSQPSIQRFIYPKGTIVLSKRSLFPEEGKNAIKYMHLLNRQFSNIDILTYDDLADKAEIIISFVETINNK